MTSKKSIIPFKGKGPKTTDDGDIIEHGEIGDLKFSVYKRGVIHIAEDDSSLVFKKDIETFDVELGNIDFEKIKNGQEFVMKGSGENDHLVFYSHKDEIKLKLQSRSLVVIEKLKTILRKHLVAK